MALLDDAFAAYMGELIDGKLIADSSPNGHHAVIEGETGVPTWQASGGPGDRPYLAFPGYAGSSFMRGGIGVAPYWAVGTADFAVAMWVYPHNTSGRLFGTRNYSTQGVLIALEPTTGSGAGRITVQADGSAAAVVSALSNQAAGGIIVDDAWNSIVVEFDRTAQVFRAEINGVLCAWFSSQDISASGSLSGTREHTHFGGHRREKSISDPDWHEKSAQADIASVILMSRLFTTQEKSDLADPDYYPTSGRFSGGGASKENLIRTLQRISGASFNG